jgi:hypothetical protein
MSIIFGYLPRVSHLFTTIWQTRAQQIYSSSFGIDNAGVNEQMCRPNRDLVSSTRNNLTWDEHFLDARGLCAIVGFD